MADKLSKKVDPIQPIQIEELGRLVRRKRTVEKLTLKQAAAQVGVSAATLSRLERQYFHPEEKGKPASKPDTDTLVAITSWLDLTMNQVLTVDSGSQVAGASEQEDVFLPDAVEAHLRADRNLKPEDAAVLGRIFRAAYQQFTTEKQETSEDVKS